MLADFIFFPTTITINATSNEVSCQIVTIVKDTIIEEDEHINITITSSDTIVLIGGPAAIIITDDDGRIQLCTL